MLMLLSGSGQHIPGVHHKGLHRLLHQLCQVHLHPRLATMMTLGTWTGGRADIDNYKPPATCHSCLFLLLLMIVLLALPDPRTEAKEAVIFKQIGQMAGVTAYLHMHVEFSISSVEVQLNKYHTLLKQHFNQNKSAVTYMSKYLQANYTYKQKMHIFNDQPEHLPNGSMIRNFIGQWVRIARLHLKDLDDIRPLHSLSSQTKSGPKAKKIFRRCRQPKTPCT
jgi:hypothetical protein